MLLGGHAKMKLVQSDNTRDLPGAKSLPLTVTPALPVQLALEFTSDRELET